MSDPRPRAFLPALLLAFVAACAGSQAVFAQEVSAARAAEEKTTATAETLKAGAFKEQPAAQASAAVREEAKPAPDAPADCGCEVKQAEPVGAAVKLDAKAFALPAKTFGAQQQDQTTTTTTTTSRKDDDDYTPLTSEQKMKRAFKSAFLSPAGYAWTAFNAAITEAGEDDLPHKDTEDRIADWGSRFAIQFGRRATRSLLGSGVYPVIFKQEPRYIKSNKKGFGARAVYAVSRVFVTRGDNGNSQFNISRVAGNISASALSNLWEQNTPGHDRIGTGPTFRRVATMFISDAIFNVFREFW
ncbi:MAG TPA: hypothetical protein VGV38_03635 [Pyrinomonadaceae bacterium]|nr:hypothetical protein [Pyrinomonadaceae bacterium]